MNSTNETNTTVNQPTRSGRRSAVAGGLLRWTSVIGLLAGIAVMGSIATTAAPASALIRFCNKTVCIGSANGCNTPTTTGVVIMADDGDSFVGTDGTKWTCTHGKWVKTATIVVSTGTGFTGVAGNTQVMQASPASVSADPVGAKADPRTSLQFTK